MSRIVVGFIVGGLVALPSAGGAETLADAWEEALASHQQIAAATARRDAAELDLESAKGARSISVDVNGSFTQLDTAPSFDFGGGVTSAPLFANDNFAAAGAQLSVPLYAGGTINAGINAAENSMRASEEHLAALRQRIKLATSEHYVQVLRAEQALEVARSNVASLEAHTAVAENRYRIGDVPHNDFLAASVSLANARQNQLQAENSLDYARAAYNRFLGRPLDNGVSLDPNLDIEQIIPASADVDELAAIAARERHELAALELQSAAFREQSDAAHGRSRPQFALTGGYMYQENEFLDREDFWMAGLTFRWDLFDGGQSRKQAASLDRRALAIDYSRNDLQTTIALEVRKAWNDRDEAAHRAAVAGNAVDQAEENLRVVRNRYDAGASTNVEVLDAESLRMQAMRNRDDARYEHALATLRLAQAAGLL